MENIERIMQESTVTLTLTVNIEDDDHRVQVLKGASGGPYIHVEDLVKRAGTARLLNTSRGELVFQELPDCLVPDVYWELVAKDLVQHLI